MSSTMLHPQSAKVNSLRFVAPLSEYEQGKALYKRGGRIEECETDIMAAGWLDAEAAGADAYWLGKMQEAN